MRLLLVVGFVLAFCGSSALAGGGPAETVVLVNSASADSRKVADHYVKRRNIPPQQVCEVKCTAGLETSMDDFVRDVVDPLRKFLHERGIEDRCRFVVLTQGMPIIAHTPGGAVSTAAALSLLDTPVCGRPQTYAEIARLNIPNPYREGSAPKDRIVAGGRFLLVTALISTTAEELMALVDRSVASDGTAPRGARFVFQDANGAANVRNDKYDAARKNLESAGFATEHDAVGAETVKGRGDVMGYMSGGAYSALTVEGVNSNKYLPGAICDMLESFGAVPENFTPGSKGSQFSVTHMVRAGVTGVHGAVSEPFSFAFPDVKLFETYAEGYTLAEAFHQRLPIVYWMNLTLGDPLCAPYAKRPAPKIDVKGAWEGVVKAELAAPGATVIDVYLDGRSVASIAGESGTVAIDTTAFENGPHGLLVEATGAGPTEPRGWIASTVATRNAPAAVAKAAPRPRCDRLVVEGPATVHAGDATPLKVTACGVDGKALDGWSGRIEVRTATPPVRWAVVDATSPAADAPLTFTKAGDYDVRVTAPDDGREAALKIHVDAGALDCATTPASNVPLGQEADLEVVVEDRFGNRIRDWEGTISVEAPQDPSAQLPLPVALTAASQGRGVLRGLLLTHAGPTTLVFKDGGGAVLSKPTEGVTVAKAAIRPWLVAGPTQEKSLVSSDPAASAGGDGAVAAKMLLRRRDGGDVVPLPPGDAKGGDAALLVTWLASVGETKARLLAAAPGRLRVFLDGKGIFDGASKGTDPKGKREPIADMKLADGVHRLVVVVETKGPTSASFEIDDGAGQFPTTLRIRAKTDTAKSFVVSGRIRATGPAQGGVRGATVVVRGADGRERTATSSADGTWWVEGLPPGETVVKAAAGGHVFLDPERKLTIEAANVVDVDFGEAGDGQRGKK